MIDGSLLFGVAAGLITAGAIVAALRRADWTKRNIGVMTAFSAASLIAAAILHAIPEALARTSEAPIWALGGFAAAYLFNKGVLGHHRHGDAHGDEHDHDHGHGRGAAIFAALAIAAHSFIDGLSYAVAFAVDWRTGVVSTLGLLLHEAPEAVIVFSLFLAAGFRSGRAAFAAFVAAGVTTPAGAVFGTGVLSLLSDAVLGPAFAVTSGVLLFIGAGHLLPHAEREPAGRALPAMALGLAIAVLGALWHPGHGVHDHDDHGAQGELDPHDHR